MTMPSRCLIWKAK